MQASKKVTIEVLRDFGTEGKTHIGDLAGQRDKMQELHQLNGKSWLLPPMIQGIQNLKLRMQSNPDSRMTGNDLKEFVKISTQLRKSYEEVETRDFEGALRHFIEKGVIVAFSNTKDRPKSGNKSISDSEIAITEQGMGKLDI